MTRPELDPQFASYLEQKPSLSYVQPNDKAMVKLVIDRLEIAMGRQKLESVYHQLKDQPFDIRTFFKNAIDAGSLNINHRGLTPSEIRTQGPLIFVANHPFGIVDGMVLCDIAAQVRGDLRIMIHAALCKDEDLAPYFLPVDFNETKHAIKTNIRSKQLALEAISNDVPLLIFPAGMVSTARKFGFGSVKDAPWTTFAAKLIRQSKATVVPIHFHGRNSRKFHIASHIALPLRTGLLMHEALNKFGGSLDVTIGNPIAWTDLQHYEHRQELTDALYAIVQNLPRQ